VKIKNRSSKQSSKFDGIGVGRIRMFPFFPIPSMTPSLMIQWKQDCRSWKQKRKNELITRPRMQHCDRLILPLLLPLLLPNSVNAVWNHMTYSIIWNHMTHWIIWEKVQSRIGFLLPTQMAWISIGPIRLYVSDCDSKFDSVIKRWTDILNFVVRSAWCWRVLNVQYGKDNLLVTP